MSTIGSKVIINQVLCNIYNYSGSRFFNFCHSNTHSLISFHNYLFIVEIMYHPLNKYYSFRLHNLSEGQTMKYCNI